MAQPGIALLFSDCRSTPAFSNYEEKIFIYVTQTRGGSRISRRRVRQPSRRGRQYTNVPDFPPKLHEIKKILVGAPPLDPPLQT